VNGFAGQGAGDAEQWPSGRASGLYAAGDGVVRLSIADGMIDLRCSTAPASPPVPNKGSASLALGHQAS
jgi:hypothetical protein